MIATGFLSLLLFFITIGFYQQRTSAAEINAEPISFYGKKIQFLKLFGQTSVTEISRNLVTAKKVDHPAGVAIDTTTSPNKVYVVDLLNNRVLGFDGAGYCSINTTKSCTVDSDCGGGESCVVDGTKPATIVFGQSDFSLGSCNRDSNVGVYKNPNRDTLCFFDTPNATNVSEFAIRSGIQTDSKGNLYLIDTFNNRVLRYDQPFSTNKSKGAGDSLADEVWGQPNFASGKINRGEAAPSAISLNTSFRGIRSHAIFLDPQDNLWVPDTENHRVLRFPSGATRADLVMGEPDFTTTSTCEGITENTLSRLCRPTQAKIDPTTGYLYVVDEFAGKFQARILVYKPPFKNGMTAQTLFKPKQIGNFNNWAGFDGQGGWILQVNNIMFNTYKQGSYNNGFLWITEGAVYRTDLVDRQGNIIKIIGAKDMNTRGGDWSYEGCQNIYDAENFHLWDSGGSIGVDKDNNMYFSDLFTQFNRVSRYSLPYEMQNMNNRTCLPDPKGGLFKGLHPNVSDMSRFSPDNFGVAVFQKNADQLIISDGSNLKAWNDYHINENGAKASIEITTDLSKRKRLSNAIDDKDRLWVATNNEKLRVYQLPLQNTTQSLATDLKLYWQDSGEELEYSVSGIAFDTRQKALYITDWIHNRILRITNYDNFQNKLTVNLVIGQPNRTSVGCNYAGSVTADGLCGPKYIKFDTLGNLYVIENDYECHDNARIISFTAETLQNAPALFSLPKAQRVFSAPSLTVPGSCSADSVFAPGSPVALAFDSQNHMVVGNDGYYANGHIDVRHLRQLWYYADPLNNATPQSTIDLPMGASGDLTFDKDDNLVVQDHTWNRVWIINLKTDPAWLINPRITPTPIPKPTQWWRRPVTTPTPTRPPIRKR